MSLALHSSDEFDMNHSEIHLAIGHNCERGVVGGSTWMRLEEKPGILYVAVHFTPLKDYVSGWRQIYKEAVRVDMDFKSEEDAMNFAESVTGQIEGRIGRPLGELSKYRPYFK